LTPQARRFDLGTKGTEAIKQSQFPSVPLFTVVLESGV